VVAFPAGPLGSQLPLSKQRFYIRSCRHPRLSKSRRGLLGTRVTSYYDWSQIAEQYRDANVFPVIPEAALRAALGILAGTVEQ
jgi:hypothetical protein